MKYAVVLAATAALALSACNKSETAADPAASEAAAPAASDAAAAPAAAGPAGAAAFTAGEPPSKEFMVGTWGEGDKCELPIQFQADGTIKDGPFAKWDIKDGALVMEGSPQNMKLKVIDANTMESQIEGNDKTHTLKRC